MTAIRLLLRRVWVGSGLLTFGPALAFSQKSLMNSSASAHRPALSTRTILQREGPRFYSERDRVKHLFGLYEKLVKPLSDAEKQSKRVARKKAKGRT